MTAEAEFLQALDGRARSRAKRHIIGEQFVKVQERILSYRAFSGWALDSGTRHDLSGHDRIRRHRQSGSDQDAPQPRGRDPEADRCRAALSNR